MLYSTSPTAEQPFHPLLIADPSHSLKGYMKVDPSMPRVTRYFCSTCGGHLFNAPEQTQHPLVSVFPYLWTQGEGEGASAVPFNPDSHSNYESCVLRIKDGKTKWKEWPGLSAEVHDTARHNDIPWHTSTHPHLYGCILTDNPCTCCCGVDCRKWTSNRAPQQRKRCRWSSFVASAVHSSEWEVQRGVANKYRAESRIAAVKWLEEGSTDRRFYAGDFQYKTVLQVGQRWFVTTRPLSPHTLTHSLLSPQLTNALSVLCSLSTHRRCRHSITPNKLSLTLHPLL